MIVISELIWRLY